MDEPRLVVGLNPTAGATPVLDPTGQLVLGSRLPDGHGRLLPAVCVNRRTQVRTRAQGALGHTSFGTLPGPEESQDLVAEVGGRPKHQWTASIDHRDAVLPAVIGGGCRDAAGARAPMHPNLLDAQLGALAHGLLGDLGPCSDHHRLHSAGDRLQIRIAPIPLDLVGVRVDGEDLIAALAQAPVHDVAPVLLGRTDTPVTATRLLARNADVASLMLCMAPPSLSRSRPDIRGWMSPRATQWTLAGSSAWRRVNHVTSTPILFTNSTSRGDGSPDIAILWS